MARPFVLSFYRISGLGGKVGIYARSFWSFYSSAANDNSQQPSRYSAHGARYLRKKAMAGTCSVHKIFLECQSLYEFFGAVC